MQVLDGKHVASVRREKLKARVEDFRKRHGRAPGLAVVLVGENPASQVYVKNKEAACHTVGIISTRFDLLATAKQEQLHELIHGLNSEPTVDGILVQLPLPKGLNEKAALDMIDPRKDPDGLHFQNMGLLMAGRPRVRSCTPYGVMKILEHYGVEVAGKRAVVVGRSNIVGKPMAQLLLEANATVTIAHSKTADLAEETSRGDIVVVAAGKPRLLGKEDFKKGAVVVDVGMHRGADGKLCGDVRFEELKDWASAATPVPGGVGPMTIQMLIENTVDLADLHQNE